MEAAALEGGFADASVDAARAFRAALDAMARPGTIHRMAGCQPPAPLSVAAGALALALCDHETPVWLAPSVGGDAVRDWLRFHTGAPLAARPEARFAFGSWDEMLPVTDFAIGTPEFPDRSATLIVEVPALSGTTRLTGPGIRTEATLSVPDEGVLWANAALYPMGLDFILTAGSEIAALPRTTKVGGEPCMSQ